MSGRAKTQGGLELARAVDSILVGHRHRKDHGDIDALVCSIARKGLLQPITITPDGVLVCGARRLEAIKRLGWTTVNVWVRSGISGRLGQLLAEQDENLLHKPLTKIEAAALYRELKTLMAEDAARRKASTQFQRGHAAGEHGGAESAPPSEKKTGKAREQAAAMVPGGLSHDSYEKIGYIEQVAADPRQPEHVRTDAASAIAQLRQGAAVHPLFNRIRAAAEGRHDDSLLRLGAEAVQRAKTAKKQRRAGNRDASEFVPMRFPTRAFLQTWGELADWWTHYDPAALALELTDEQIAAFLTAVDGTVQFAERLRTARAGEAEDPVETEQPRHLRAL